MLGPAVKIEAPGTPTPEEAQDEEDAIQKTSAAPSTAPTLTGFDPVRGPSTEPHEDEEPVNEGLNSGVESLVDQHVEEGSGSIVEPTVEEEEEGETDYESAASYPPS